MEEAITMVKSQKMKYRGCCSNCLLTKEETDIYRIEIKNETAIELCKSCLSKFAEELNKAYSETVGD